MTEDPVSPPPERPDLSLYQVWIQCGQSSLVWTAVVLHQFLVVLRLFVVQDTVNDLSH